MHAVVCWLSVYVQAKGQIPDFLGLKRSFCYNYYCTYIGFGTSLTCLQFTVTVYCCGGANFCCVNLNAYYLKLISWLLKVGEDLEMPPWSAV